MTQLVRAWQLTFAGQSCLYGEARPGEPMNQTNNKDRAWGFHCRPGKNLDFCDLLIVLLVIVCKFQASPELRLQLIFFCIRTNSSSVLGNHDIMKSQWFRWYRCLLSADTFFQDCSVQAIILIAAPALPAILGRIHWTTSKPHSSKILENNYIKEHPWDCYNLIYILSLSITMTSGRSNK